MSSPKKPVTAVTRMKRDYMRLKKDPLPYVTAEPLPQNILEWHYCVKGPEDSPYFGGYYHGVLQFPREFPFKPPSIFMMTPNGRFRTNTRLCLSISDFHPDTWNPTWCVGTILTGLLSFMLEKTPTFGSVETSVQEKKLYAKQSLEFNLNDPTFCELFPEIVEEIKARLSSEQQQQQGQQKQANGAPSKMANKQPNGVIEEATAGASVNTAAVPTVATETRTVADNAINADANNVGNALFNWHYISSNLIIILLFCIFALIVNYVLRTINNE